MTPLPEHLRYFDGWIAIEGLGWLRWWHHEPWNTEGTTLTGPDLWWWHDCPPMRGEPGWGSPRTIDVSSGHRHAIIGGTLDGGDLTIHGGSGSIPCEKCGLHGHLAKGIWTPC